MTTNTSGQPPLAPSSRILARTAAMSRELAQKILDLYTVETQAALAAMSDQGKPALMAIGKSFAEYAQSAEAKRLRIALGMVAHEILEPIGYVLDRSGVRTEGDPFFTTASRYRRAGPGIKSGPADDGLLAHMLHGLDAPRLRELAALVAAVLAAKGGQ